MSTHEDFMDASLSGNTLFHPTRRDFLAALASCSGALFLGAPSVAQAGRHQFGLQEQVVQLVGRMRRQGLIRSDEKTSWSVYDFTTRQKLVAINKDIPRQAASMIKPFVAQAYFYKRRFQRADAVHERRAQNNGAYDSPQQQLRNEPHYVNR